MYVGVGGGGEEGREAGGWGEEGHACVFEGLLFSSPPSPHTTQFGMVRATSILNRCSITVTHSDSECVNECMLFEGCCLHGKGPCK